MSFNGDRVEGEAAPLSPGCSESHTVHRAPSAADPEPFSMKPFRQRKPTAGRQRVKRHLMGSRTTVHLHRVYGWEQGGIGSASSLWLQSQNRATLGE